jgi:predicted small lipoprotein YifL
MRRRLALIAILLLLPLAGCGGRTEGTLGEVPTAETTTAPTVTATPTSTPATRPSQEPTATTTKVSNVSKAKPSGSRDPRWGTQYAILKSSRLSTRQITYDLIEWYDGKQAVRACAEDGVKPAENDYCEGWYIRNSNKKLRTLTVYPDAPIRMPVAGEMKSVDLKTFLSEVGNGNVIRFDIDANRIMKLEHVYLP